MGFINLSRKVRAYADEEENYTEIVRVKEQEYKQALRQAASEYEMKGKRHSKEEYEYLKKALQKCKEIADISEGAEREHRLGQAKNIEMGMREIIKELNPPVTERVVKKEEEKRKTPISSATSVAPDRVDSSSNQDEEEDELADEVKKWFKEPPKHSFDDVSGMEKLKKTLRKGVNRYHKILRKYLNLPNVQSYLFVGPPGCGKTYIIEAFAHELMEKDYKYISVVASDILSKLVGESEKKVQRLFEEAEKNAPCIVFIDEIDALCKNRSGDVPEYTKSLTTSFLTGYNMLKNSKDKDIVFISATNYPNNIDDAMIDRIQLIEVPLPDEEARKSAFRRVFQPVMKLKEDIDFSYMAKQSNNYNYRDIERLNVSIKKKLVEEITEVQGMTDEEGIEALKNGQICLTKELFDKIQGEFIPTPKDNILREIEAWKNRMNQ